MTKTYNYIAVFYKSVSKVAGDEEGDKKLKTKCILPAGSCYVRTFPNQHQMETTYNEAKEFLGEQLKGSYVKTEESLEDITQKINENLSDYLISGHHLYKHAVNSVKKVMRNVAEVDRCASIKGSDEDSENGDDEKPKKTAKKPVKKVDDKKDSDHGEKPKKIAKNAKKVDKEESDTESESEEEVKPKTPVKKGVKKPEEVKESPKTSTKAPVKKAVKGKKVDTDESDVDVKPKPQVTRTISVSDDESDEEDEE